MTIFSEFHFGLLVLLVFSINSYSIDGLTIENPVQLSRDDYCPPEYKRKHFSTLQHVMIMIMSYLSAVCSDEMATTPTGKITLSNLAVGNSPKECYFDIYAPVGQYVQMTCSDVYRSAWTNYFMVIWVYGVPAISTLICFLPIDLFLLFILAAWNGRENRVSTCTQKDLHFV
jgi:hypothetical protein